MTQRPKPLQIVVDYPREGDVITGRDYTFRLGAVPEALAVEVSLNGGDWRPCRESMGLWWFDWSGYGNGDYELRARIRDQHRKPQPPVVRRFAVRLD